MTWGQNGTDQGRWGGGVEVQGGEGLGGQSECRSHPSTQTGLRGSYPCVSEESKAKPSSSTVSR